MLEWKTFCLFETLSLKQLETSLIDSNLGVCRSFFADCPKIIHLIFLKLLLSNFTDFQKNL